MRFHVRGLDDKFTYPCTRKEVKEAFDDLAKSASFGPTPDHFFSRSEVPLIGRVITEATIGKDHSSDEYRQCANLYLYRIPKLDWEPLQHGLFMEILRTQIRPWIESMLARPEIAWGGHDSMLIELNEGRLLVHTRRGK